jgi:hypothetical protein
MRRASGSPHFVRAGERRIYPITKLPIYQILSESMPSYTKLETKIRVMDGTKTLAPSHFQNENSFNKILTIQLLPVIYYRL